MVHKPLSPRLRGTFKACGGGGRGGGVGRSFAVAGDICRIYARGSGFDIEKKPKTAKNSVDYTVKGSDGSKTRISGFAEFAKECDADPSAQISDTDKPMFNDVHEADESSKVTINNKEPKSIDANAQKSKGGINLAFADDDKSEGAEIAAKAGRYVDLDFAQILDSAEIPRENQRYAYSQNVDAMDGSDPQSADIDLDS